MVRYLRVVAVLALIGAGFSDTVSQTDWSGGDGVQGPDWEWFDTFWTCSQIDWSGSPGDLLLGVGAAMPAIPHDVDLSFQDAHCVAGGDIDEDGDMDIVACAGGTDEVAWYENVDGSGTSWTKHSVMTGINNPQTVRVCDINADDHLDIAAAGYSISSGALMWWAGDGTGTSWIDFTVDSGCGPYMICVEDIDGDDDQDILGDLHASNSLVWWENEDGVGGSWTENIVDSSISTTISCWAADIDGDGDTDAIASSAATEDVYWYENLNGVGTSWTKRTVDPDVFEPNGAQAADIDQDGDMDLICASLGDDYVSWWENEDGTGTSWIEHTVGTFDGCYGLYVGDLNGDDLPDVAAVGNSTGYWWSNDGMGLSWTGSLFFDAGSYVAARSVSAADLDGDADQDLLAAITYNDDLKWYEITGYWGSGELESSILEIPIPIRQLVNWGQIFWNALEPSGTSVSFLVRGSNDPGDMGPWSDTITVWGTELDSILGTDDYYLQYKALLSSDDPLTTPTLEDIAFTYETPGGGTGETPPVTGLSVPVNPSVGGALLQLSLESPCDVRVEVLDLMGRTTGVSERHYDDGVYQLLFDNLPSGVYFARMTVEDFVDTVRLVVLE